MKEFPGVRTHCFRTGLDGAAIVPDNGNRAVLALIKIRGIKCFRHRNNGPSSLTSHCTLGIEKPQYEKSARWDVEHQ